MKKLIVILFFFIPFLSKGAYNYTSNLIIVNSDVSKGKLTVEFRKHDGSTNPTSNIFNARMYYRYGTAGNWIKIYDQDSTTVYPNAVLSHPPYPLTPTILNNNQYIINFAELPGAFFQTTVQVRFDAKWSGGSGSDKFPDIITTINNEVKPLINTNATTDIYCDLINITWGLPSYVNTSKGYTESPYRQTQIFSGHNNVTALKHTVTSQAALSQVFNDLSPQPGVNTDYTIRPILVYSATRIAVGAPVNITGRRYPNPNAPTGLFLERIGCNGAIEVSWNWIDANPDNFIIVRSDNAAFTSNIQHFISSGSIYTYRDNTTSTGVKYYYRVHARDNCPNNATLYANSGASADVSQVGGGIPPATSVTGISIDTVGKSVTVTWADNTELEDGFKVVRSSGSGQVEFDVGKNMITYTDATANSCEAYTYKIKTYNSCNTAGVLSTNSFSAFIPSDVTTTFDATTNKVEASDGEFGDRIVLKWKTTNRQNEDWIITRINPVTHDTTQIASVGASTKFYTDNTANANTIYEYNIQGELDCGGTIVKSNITTDVGFRLAFGTVNGQVTYQGGTAVKGVRMTATAVSGTSGKSLNIFSSPINNANSGALVTENVSLAADHISIVTFIRPDSLDGIGVIAGQYGHIRQQKNGWRLYLDGTDLKFTVNTTTISVTPDTAELKLHKWLSVAATASGDSMKIFIDGVLRKAVASTASAIVPVPTPTQTAYPTKFRIGYGGAGVTNEVYYGEIDEMRFYNRALSDEEIAQTYNVFINPSMNGLRGYWRFDEGFGNTAFDYSKTLLTPNNNHAELFFRTSWSSSVPSSRQLSAGAYTDSLGSYFIPFIPYLGTGDNYTITPQFGTHSFTPATTTLLIGNGAASYNGQDFLDNSSFRVKGNIKYDSTTCPVQGARVLIDGESVIENGTVIMTDEKGVFIIQVPIGPHVITVEKSSHVFNAGRYPASGAHDFQQNITGIDFKDSTLVKVVGRVAGGSIQKDLPPALGKGINNIGVATIPFKSDGANTCLDTTVTTNAVTGEYEIYLPPIKYVIDMFTVNSNAIKTFDTRNLDIEDVPPSQVSRDSVFQIPSRRKGLLSVDSATYQKQLDFIDNVFPSIGVIGKEESTLYGAKEITIEDAGVKITIPDSSLKNLAHPVFEENAEYKWIITAFEIYENRDSVSAGKAIKFDSVPMIEGKILIQNSLASNSRTEYEYSIVDSIKFNGIQEYSFTAGQANTSKDGTVPSNSFTKNCEITLRPDAGNAVSWTPNPMNGLFKGIIFGARALGSNFSTAGPDVVTMILRDPPGSESFASWSKGTTTTTTQSWSNSAGVGADLSAKISVGTEFTVGLGYSTKTEISNEQNRTLKTESTINLAGEIVSNNTANVTITTGAGDEFVGADADLFFGRAMNMDFGLSQSLTLVDTSLCGDNTECVGSTIMFNAKPYRLATTFNMFAVPGGYETQFVFTQAGIENSVIPKLIDLRNQLLEKDPRYTIIASKNTANFGKSNDDLIFGAMATPEPEVSGIQDSAGLSYTFSGYTKKNVIYNDTTVYPDSAKGIAAVFTPKNLTIITGVDSVWWYNKQIRLWEETLEQNEREKANTVSTGPTNPRNISYIGGSSITYTTSTDRTGTDNRTINFNMSTGLALKLGAKIGGIGGEIEAGAALSYSHGSNVGSGTTNSASFEYTIFDPDGDDEFSVDVFEPKDGFGPVFKTRGGKTSCPYQGETVTKYHQPGLVLDKATIQLEQPRITAAPASLFNVPADGQGNITLKLINDGLEDAVYALKVLESSNPYGLILKIDGIGLNRDFAVPAKVSITKTLSIQKGPFHIAYDSIALVFHSKCQYAFGTAGYEDIADTVYIAVNFLPSCTELDIQSPQNQFIVNTSYENELPIIVSGYDINYGGLEKIRLQYKASNQANWRPIETEWFKSLDSIDLRYPQHPDAKLIPRNQAYINYTLDLAKFTDQNYDLRAISTCKIPFNPLADQESSVISGIIDRKTPEPFGTPSPADGVLDPNDDISIQFNENIAAGSLGDENFQLTGVLNGGVLRHNKAVAFDGSTSYLKIDNGFDFASNNFTIEFYAKRAELGRAQTIISQGTDVNNSFSIGFDANDKLEVKLGSKTTKTNPITDDTYWVHYAITYDKENSTLETTARLTGDITLIGLDSNFYTAYTGAGKTYIGKSANDNNFFNGSIHQFRIWNKVLSSPEVSSRINLNLHGKEAGLVGFWPMDEGRGLLAEDISRFRHAEVFAGWELNPKSTAADFDGVNKCVLADTTGALSITAEMDLSLEFWFKTNGGQLQTFLSNGGAMFTPNDDNRNGWNIEMNAQNEIWVKNDSFAFEAVKTDFADNKWHQFALVVNRLTSATAFIDGVQQEVTSSSNFQGFNAAKLAIGARYSQNGLKDTLEQFFNGKIDEVRIWNTALLRDNIELNQYNRLSGDEFGLLAYYPFESYQIAMGVPTLNSSLANQSSVLTNHKKLNARAVNGSVYTTESPAIALQRPVLDVIFTYIVNNDKIVFNIDELESPRIENVTLNISVQDVSDLHGNKMQSAKKWIAFVNKNQVLWQDAGKNLNMEFNDTLTFTSKIVNSGGEVKNFTISNIPPWLSVSQSSGTISPLSTETITFTVNQGINIGTYTEDLILTTDFGVNEKLLVKLKVRKTPPNLDFNLNLFSKSMSIIAQIRINGSVSVNGEDIVVAYINDSIRGKANLQYLEVYDKYVAFLDVYSNQSDSITFKVWNASKGELHNEVTPNLYFVEDDLIGTPSSPQFFDAEDRIIKPIALKQGWNWVSFPLYNSKMNSLYHFLYDMNFAEGDQIKTTGTNAFANHGSTANSWPNGFELNNYKSYLIRINTADTIQYSGLIIDPDTMPIPVEKGWNRIGYVATKNLAVNTALANFNASEGDVLKSQQKFAYYDSNLGWIGSLTAMKPLEGYLLKSASTTTFTYPRRGLFRLKQATLEPTLEGTLPTLYTLNPNSFEASTNAIIKVKTCEELLSNPDWGLAAFKNKELRGWVKAAKFVNEEMGSEYFITVYGNGNETFTFKMVNTVTGEEMGITTKLDFKKNKVQGVPSKPLAFDLVKEINCDQFKKVEETILTENLSEGVYPNPFSSFLTIVIPQEISENGTVEIFDQNGRLIFERNAGTDRKIFLNGAELFRFTNGVYQLKFVDGETVITEKLVRIK
jgi:hypothetical protein